MTAIPALVFLTAATVLGVYLGFLYLRRIVRKPVLIGVHLLLGAAGIEMTVMLLRGTPGGEATPAGTFGVVAAGLLALAMVSGLAAPLLGRRSRQTANIMLSTHAGIALAGFALFLAWMTNA